MSKLTSVLRDHGVGAISGSSNAPYFGTGADGDLIITAPTLTAAMTSAPIGGDVNALYDGTESTIFKTNNTNAPTPTLIQVDLGSVQWVCNLWFSGWSAPSTSSDGTFYAVQTSVDGTNWIMRKSGFDASSGGNNGLPTHPATPKELVAKFMPVQARYVALIWNSTNYSSRSHWINQLRIGSGRIINVPIEDVTTVVKSYENLSVGSDCTLTVDKRCRGLIMYARGNIDIAGTLDISGKAAYVDTTTLPQIMLPIEVRRAMQFDPLKNKIVAVPKGGSGGTGGDAGWLKAIGDGGSGGSGGLGTWYGGGVGGGGGGGSALIGDGIVSVGGNGGVGSSGPGGSGGTSVVSVNSAGISGKSGGIGAGGSGSAAASTGSPTNTAQSGAGGSGINGGGGGGGGGAVCALSSPATATGGSGANGGNYGGGALIMVCRGNFNLQSTGSILAYAVGAAGAGGAKGAVGFNSASGGGGGGGAGGGTVTIIHKGTYSNLGRIAVNGTAGAPGGTGSSSYAGSGGQAGASGGIGSIAIHNLDTL